MKQARVAICLIVFNEERNIEGLLTQIIEERVPNFEIFIDSSGSTDNTRQIVNEFERKFADKITILHEDKRKGKHIAYNHILERIKGFKYAIFLDGDVNIQKSSLNKLIRILKTRRGLKVAGANLVPKNIRNHKIPRIYQKVKVHALRNQKYKYFAGRAFAARTKYLPYIPEDSYTDDFYLNLKFKPEETVVLEDAQVDYVMPYSLRGMYKHSFHIGNTLSDIRDNYPELWEKQLKRIPLVDYVVFGLTRFNFGGFWNNLDITEKLIFIYSRIVTIAGFLHGYWSKRKFRIWEPINETKNLID